MPSKSTRHFLTQFHHFFPLLPMYALVDPDPSGLDIYRVCKYGADRSAHDDLALPAIELLGVTMTDLIELGLIHQKGVGLPLTQADEKKINKMIHSDVGRHDSVIRGECEAMIATGKKAEIESLARIEENYITDTYLIQKMKKIANQQARARAQVQPSASGHEGDQPSDVQPHGSAQPAAAASSSHSARVAGGMPMNQLIGGIDLALTDRKSHPVTNPTQQDQAKAAIPYPHAHPIHTTADDSGVAPMDIDGQSEDESEALF